MMRLNLFFICLYFITLPLLWALSLSEAADAHLARILIIPLTFLTLLIGLWVRNLYVPRGTVIFFFFAWLISLLFSLVYTPVPEWTFRKVLYFWLFAPLVWIVIQMSINKQSALITLTKSIVWGGVIAACTGLLQFFAQFLIGRDHLASLWVSITPFFLGGTLSETVITFNSWYVHILGYDLFRAIGFFPDPHVYAFYTGLIIPLTYGLYRHTAQKKYLWATLLILTANLMTFSRGAEIALLAGLCSALCLFWKSLPLHKKHGILFGGAFLICITLLPSNSLTARLLSSLDASDTSNSARIEIWTEALVLWSQNPLLGTSLGAYSFAVDPSTDYRTPIYAHNLFLDLGVELGALGLILFLGLLASMCSTFLRSTHPFAPYAIISMSIFLTHSMFDTALYSVHVFPIFLFIVAYAITLQNTSRT